MLYLESIHTDSILRRIDLPLEQQCMENNFLLESEERKLISSLKESTTFVTLFAYIKEKIPSFLEILPYPPLFV